MNTKHREGGRGGLSGEVPSASPPAGIQRGWYTGCPCHRVGTTPPVQHPHGVLEGEWETRTLKRGQEDTVEPVYEDHPGDQENVVSVDRWSLCRGGSV